MPNRDPAKAVQVLDLLLGFFGDDGEHWLKQRLGDGKGNRCLVGALAYVRRQHHFKGDGAGHYLADAIPCRIATLIEFNDMREDFAAIRELIVRARAMAQAELAATAQPKRIAGPRVARAADTLSAITATAAQARPREAPQGWITPSVAGKGVQAAATAFSAARD